MKATDFQAGIADAKAGIYDKWYRYNRKDDGAWYDRGWQFAVTTGIAYQSSDTLQII